MEIQMRARVVAASIIALLAMVGCDRTPVPQPEASPVDIEIDVNYHLISEGPDGRTILSFDRWGQVHSGGQLLSDGEISGSIGSHIECRDDQVRCTYDGEDAVPIALSTAPAVIARFYEARTLEADSNTTGDCAVVEVRRVDQILKLYRFCQMQGLIEVETFAATGHPRKIVLLDNCGIGSSDACEAQVPPVPLSLPEL